MAQPEEILKNVLVTVATEQNIKNYDVEITPLTTEGANYTSVIYKAIISAPNHAGLDLFAKVTNLAESIRDQMEATHIYETERIFYTHLMNIYEQLQNKYNITNEDRFKIPRFYGYNPNPLEETIVLENLVSQGYTMFDRFKTVNWEYASKGVEEMAKFHALSFAYKHEYPEDNAHYCSKFDITKLMPFQEFNAVFSGMAQMAFTMISKDLKLRLEKYIAEQWNEEAFNKYYGPGKWQVLVHGDYRNSNILFKRQGGKVKSLVPIDYQTLHMGSPSTDLLYFIYSGTDEEFRRLHLKQLLNHYYGTLSKYMRLFNLDPDQVFSRKDFDEDFRDMLPHGLNTAIFLLPIVLVNPADAPRMDTEGADLSNFAVKPNEGFKKRFIPIVNEFIRFGIL